MPANKLQGPYGDQFWAEDALEQLEAKLLAKESGLRDLATMLAVNTSILEVESILSVVTVS